MAHTWIVYDKFSASCKLRTDPSIPFPHSLPNTTILLQYHGPRAGWRIARGSVASWPSSMRPLGYSDAPDLQHAVQDAERILLAAHFE